MTDQEKYRIMKQNKRILKEQKEAYSLWCTELYRLSIAHKVSYCSVYIIHYWFFWFITVSLCHSGSLSAYMANYSV